MFAYHLPIINNFNYKALAVEFVGWHGQPQKKQWQLEAQTTEGDLQYQNDFLRDKGCRSNVNKYHIG
jgi:hypothetical protein